MLIRALLRFFPEKDSEVQLFNVDTRNYNIFHEEEGAIALVRDYLEGLKQTYANLEIETIKQATEIELTAFVSKVQ